MSIVGNMAGCYSPIGKTFVITDDNGNEMTGVVTAQEQVFTATDNDVREGLIYASDDGVSTGTKDIPSYRTTQGVYLVFSGDEFLIPLSDYSQYDYTELQCIIAPFDTDIDNSVASDKIVLNNTVYPTNSNVAISSVSKDSSGQTIKLNITNDTDNMYVVHYLTYREEN